MMEEDEDNLSVKTPAKIMVIDDQEGARNLLKRRLSIFGHEVILAADEAQALEKMKKVAVDVIFLNMVIQSQSTYEFLRSLKENQDYSSIPVIMLSSENDTEMVVRCIEAGAEDYLVRPLNQTLVRARLANCIARKEAHDKEIAYLAQIEQGQKHIAAQEKMASLGVLMTSISRELKNPLNFIINFSQVTSECSQELVDQLILMKDNLAAHVFENLSQRLTKLESNSRKIYEYGSSADKIIRFMLDQSNSSSSGQRLSSSINSIISQTITMLLGKYKTNGITKLPKIEEAFDSSLPRISLSLQAFSKAINNVLDNSIYSVVNKFDDISQAKVRIKTENLVNKIRISIYDNGQGIKPDVLPQVFTPFFTTKPEGVGLGLGLSTAKEVIDELEGTIEAQSVEGESAEFTITIPVKEE